MVLGVGGLRSPEGPSAPSSASQVRSPTRPAWPSRSTTSCCAGLPITLRPHRRHGMPLCRSVQRTRHLRS